MKYTIEFLFWFVGLVLFQVLLLNHIQIAGVINPFLYIYFIIALPIHTNRISLIFTGFALGMVIHWLPAKVKRWYRLHFALLPIWAIVLLAAITIVVVYQFVTADMQAFIYFQF